MTKKFEAGKTYINKKICGTFTYFEELTVEEVMSTGSISGTWNSYFIDAKGNRYNGSPRNFYTRVRKANGKDYQMTTDLYIKFYASEEL